MDDALLTQNFAKIRCCLLESRKYTRYRGVYLCNAMLVMQIFCYR